MAFFYSENAKHQHVAFSHGNHLAAGAASAPRSRSIAIPVKRANAWGLSTGASVWIREQMDLHFAELDALGLDFYHLSEENVHRARAGSLAKSR